MGSSENHIQTSSPKRALVIKLQGAPITATPND